MVDEELSGLERGIVIGVLQDRLWHAGLVVLACFCADAADDEDHHIVKRLDRTLAIHSDSFSVVADVEGREVLTVDRSGHRERYFLNRTPPEDHGQDRSTSRTRSHS